MHSFKTENESPWKLHLFWQAFWGLTQKLHLLWELTLEKFFKNEPQLRLTLDLTFGKW